jgi:hypothetical protein
MRIALRPAHDRYECEQLLQREIFASENVALSDPPALHPEQ